jgi:Ca2+-binding RTX toxin-like protein
MATLTFYRAFADLDLGAWYGEVRGTGSSITISDGYHSERFTGSFKYDYWGDEVIGGTLTGYSYSQGGSAFAKITGASVSAVTAYNYYMSQNVEALFALMLAGNDTVKGSKYSDVLTGYGGNDKIYGGAGDDLLVGGDGDDLLDGGTGADLLLGGMGNDTYVIDSLDDSIFENTGEGMDLVNVAIAMAGGSYTLGANLENATLTNKVAFDLVGNELNNVLKGNAAANRIDGGLGADRMEGGAGNDTYVVDNLNDSIYDSAGIDTVETSLAYTLGDRLENLVLTGSASVSGTGNSLANILDGSRNSGANILSGLGGNDTYIVGAGDSVIENDVKGGIDLVKSYVDFELGLNLENLTLLGTARSAIGNAQANVLTGNDGNNLLDGRGGVDKLLGGKGDDTYIIDLTSKNSLEDKIIELAGEGRDTLVLRGGSDSLKATTLTLQANLENLDASETGTTKLNLTGNAADNLLIGNAASNVLIGGAGNDQLHGGGGADILIGGRGADIMSGGTGNDIFRFTSLQDLGLGSADQDIILDFTRGEDKLDFKALKGYSFKGNAAFDGAKQLRYDLADDGLVLYGNSGGDLNPEFSIKLLGIAQLSGDDLILA